MSEPPSATPEQAEAIRFAALEAYRRHSDELCKVARSLTRNQALAQDVLQETFLRYFLTRMQREEIANERAWLLRVLRGVIQDWKRAVKNEDVVALTEAEGTAARSPQEGEASPGRPWTIRTARLLAPRERECIRLRALGLEYREIATAMHIDIGTVGALLNRAIRKLKSMRLPRETMS